MGNQLSSDHEGVTAAIDVTPRTKHGHLLSYVRQSNCLSRAAQTTVNRVLLFNFVMIRGDEPEIEAVTPPSASFAFQWRGRVIKKGVHLTLED